MSRWQDDAFDERETEFYEPRVEDEFDEEFLWRTYPSDRCKSHAHKRSRSRAGEFGYYSTFVPFCEHKPHCVLKSREGGWSVSAGAGSDCRDKMEKFDLLLNLTGESVFGGDSIPVPELARWQRPPLVPEIVLDWPDRGVIALPREFWMDLIGYLALKRIDLLVFCLGGHGRTGTAIASIMTVCGWESADAIAWVRANYCSRAIETKRQEAYVRMIAGDIGEVSRNELSY